MEQHYYPPPSFHFKVDFTIPGVGKTNGNDIFFQSASGIDVKIDTETIHEGGWNNYSHELPKRVQYSSVTLKRGLLHKQSKVMEWIMDSLQMRIVPASVNITLLNESHEPLVTWNLVHAWVKKWSFSDLDSQKSEVMIETIELRYNYFTVI